MRLALRRRWPVVALAGAVGFALASLGIAAWVLQERRTAAEQASGESIELERDYLAALDALAEETQSAVEERCEFEARAVLSVRLEQRLTAALAEGADVFDASLVFPLADRLAFDESRLASLTTLETVALDSIYGSIASSYADVADVEGECGARNEPAAITASPVPTWEEVERLQEEAAALAAAPAPDGSPLDAFDSALAAVRDAAVAIASSAVPAIGVESSAQALDAALSLAANSTPESTVGLLEALVSHARAAISAQAAEADVVVVPPAPPTAAPTPTQTPEPVPIPTPTVEPEPAPTASEAPPIVPTP